MRQRRRAPTRTITLDEATETWIDELGQPWVKPGHTTEDLLARVKQLEADNHSLRSSFSKDDSQLKRLSTLLSKQSRESEAHKRHILEAESLYEKRVREIQQSYQAEIEQLHKRLSRKPNLIIETKEVIRRVVVEKVKEVVIKDRVQDDIDTIKYLRSLVDKLKSDLSYLTEDYEELVKRLDTPSNITLPDVPILDHEG